MAQFNFLNVPAVHQAAQQSKAFAEDRKYTKQVRDDERQLSNTRFLAGSAQVVKQLGQENPEMVVPAMMELSEEMIRRGLVDPKLYDPQKLQSTPIAEILAKNEETLAQAMAGLAGRPLVPRSDMMSDRDTSAQRNFQQRMELVQQFGEGSPEVRNFDEMVRASRVVDIGNVPTRVTGIGGAAGGGTATPLSTLRDEAESLETINAAERVGTDVGTRYTNIQDAGFAAPTTIARLNRMEAIGRNIKQGKLEGIKKGLAEYGQALGFDVDVVNLSEQQAFNAIANEMALELRNPAGGAGMPGAMSDKDREFLVSMVPSLTNTVEGNMLIIQYRKRQAERDRQVAEMARRYRREKGTLDDGFFDVLQDYSDKNPLFDPERDFEDIWRAIPSGATIRAPDGTTRVKP